MDKFEFYLEKNLLNLWKDLNKNKYLHGGYRIFYVSDNKKRKISVASIRDRIIHRLIYDFLVIIYDKTFIFDVWSCRKNKGLFGAIERTQNFLESYPRSFIWRADIKKFFESVDQKILLEIIYRKIKDLKTLELLEKIITSFKFSEQRENNFFQQKGMAIGNLTSQIFANIYLNELDRFIKNYVKPLVYLRYGDDFIIFSENYDLVVGFRKLITNFINKNLLLQINPKNDIIIKARWGLKFLGVQIFPKGRKLNKRNLKRIVKRLNLTNFSSYAGLVKKHSKAKKINEFNWFLAQKLEIE